jgi:hypothetical protein
VKAPLLQSFWIECDDLYDIESYFSFHRNIFEGGAPALTSVRIGGWGLHQCLPPLTSVTSLTLSSAIQLMEWRDFRDMVGGHLSLTHLAIGEIFDGRSIPDNFDSTVVLPSLKSLRIHANQYGHTFENQLEQMLHTDKILLAISASALECLVLDQIIQQD